MLPDGFLLVDVDDVFHQQVPLKSIYTMSVQNHFMSTGRAAESAPWCHSGASSCGQVWVRGLLLPSKKEELRKATGSFSGTYFHSAWLWTTWITLSLSWDNLFRPNGKWSWNRGPGQPSSTVIKSVLLSAWSAFPSVFFFNFHPDIRLFMSWQYLIFNFEINSMIWFH